MWIVKLALRRPYTFVVAALLLVVTGVGVVRRTPTDILPNVDVPVISVVWTYTGLPAQVMEQQITQFSEFSLSGNVAGIRYLESQTYDGAAVIKLYLHEGEDVAAATAQATAVSQTILRRMPPGTQPPVIVRYSATSVPILQIAFSSPTLSEAEIYDHVNLRVRSALSTIRGTRFPLPNGGRFRQIVVDLIPQLLEAHGVSAADVSAAIAAQNLTLPTGTAKLGEQEVRVSLNSSPEAITALNDVPIRKADGSIVFVRDVAHAHDGFAVQTNIARANGQRAVVLSVIKTGDASTTDIAARVKAMLPMLQKAAPDGLKMELLADQSIFVTRAVDGLLTEGILAASLTALMILLFLGSWRSTLIVAISIPLSVIAALLVMRALGHTINTMTLGGFALAVGILVDDATVEIENIHRHLAMDKPLVRAILDGAQEIALPAFVASVCIAIVFLAVLVLEGPAKYLFQPLGLAVGLSVLASYILSRTLVPTLVMYLLRGQVAHRNEHTRGGFARIHQGFERAFARLQRGYAAVLSWLLRARTLAIMSFAGVGIATLGIAPSVGRDFFPIVDLGQIRLHITAPPGTRLEETDRWFARVEAAIAEMIPEGERSLLLGQLGLPSGYTLAVTDTANISSADGELLIRLTPARTRSTREYVELLRNELPRKFPELTFYFQPADMVTQVLNFGLPAPIDIQVSGANRVKTLAIAQSVERSLRANPSIADVRLHQVLGAPRLHLEVDRVRASEVGLSQRDVASNVLVALSGTGQVNPGYWTDPNTGNSYSVNVQVPEHRIATVDDLLSLSATSAHGPQQLRDLAEMQRKAAQVVSSRVNVQPTFNVRADLAEGDLGTAAAAIEEIVAAHRKELPPGANIAVRGQIDSMQSAFSQLTLGLLLAGLLVYCLLVVNFQSWLDPLLIFGALPGAAIGIVWALWLTGTTLNVPSLMGAIMSIGVGTANAILVVTFAKHKRLGGASAVDSARDAGTTRLRPVLMTALAMIIGMFPMALNLHEGGEQNAALARAVIGGLVGATFATLLFVPVLFSLLPSRAHKRVAELEGPV